MYKFMVTLIVVLVFVVGCTSVNAQSNPETLAQTAQPATVGKYIPLEQAIVGAWVNDKDDSLNVRYHVYTEDGKYCFGSHLPSLLKDDAPCFGYEIDGNILSEFCLEESIGCTPGLMCKVEVEVLSNGQLSYTVPKRCPGYRHFPDVWFGSPIMFERVENADES